MFSPLTTAIFNDKVEIYDMLLDLEKFDVNAVEENGLTPLIAAICHEDEDLVCFLLEDMNADVNICDKNGISPFLYAIKHESNAIDLILNKITNINHKDIVGNSPILVACCAEMIDIVEKLIIKGAEIHTSNLGGLSPLLIVANNGNGDIVKLLLENIKNRNDFEEIINHSDVKGLTPLIVSCMRGNFDIMKILHHTGADVTVLDAENFNAFMYACRGGHENIIEYFIHNVRNAKIIEQIGKGGTTALDLSIRCGHENAVRLLLTYGCKPKHGYKNGCSAIMEAAILGYDKTVELVMYVVDNLYFDGKSLMYYAQNSGCEKLIKILQTRENTEF